ncbi:MAG: HAMP domain-containing histidine kinase [Curvibacter sp.]|nr:MAG: HAMP domain-containing histidine kinase [Curvibacter sp.]
MDPPVCHPGQPDLRATGRWREGRTTLMAQVLRAALDAFIGPGVRLMRRSRYKFKFALVAVCVLLPLSAMSLVIQRFLSERIQRIELELDGLVWIRALNGVDFELSRLAMTDPSWPALAYVPQSEAFSRLARLPWSPLQNATPPEKLLKALDTFQTDCPRPTTDMARQDLAGMSCVAHLRDWIYDSSGLVLDPKLESYYLGHLVTVSFPQLAQALRRLPVSLRLDSRRRESEWLQVLEEVLRRTDAIQQDAARLQSSSVPWRQIVGPLEALESQVRTWHDQTLSRRLGERAQMQEALATHAAGFLAGAEAAEQALLRELTRQRVLAGELRLIVIGALLFGGLSMLYLFSAFYVATLKDIDQLERATREVLQGAGSHLSDLDVARLRLPSHDELSAISDAFVAFALRLVADNERLRQLEVQLSREKVNAEAALDELNQAQDTLVQSEKMASLGALVAGVAHEVNTPLGVAVTSTSHWRDEAQEVGRLLTAGTLRQHDLERFLQSLAVHGDLVARNLGRASELIKSFKTMSVDQSSEARRRFDLLDYAREVLRSLHTMHSRRPIEVMLRGQAGISLDSYPGALAQVLTNLMSNALTHAFEPEASGRIVIDVEAGNTGWARLCFADSGQGIAKEHLARVFDPFFTTARSRGGSGLGLSIVYTLVTQRLQGRIEVHSRPGQGCRFDLLLPLQVVVPAVSPPERAESGDDGATLISDCQ